MRITTLSGREFNRSPSSAKRAASDGPVIITDRGRPAHVLLTIDAYQHLTRQPANMADLLAMSDAADIDFEVPQVEHIAKPVHLG